MALIGTLRTKMTKFVVGFVALAMGAFIVGSDLFGSGPRSVFGGNKNNIGEIAGTSISNDDYRNFVQDQENDYYLRMGRQPGEKERSTLQNQAWELMIVKYAIESEMLKAGVKVTADEAEDMLWGKNIDPGIKQQFTDSTGKFNREAVKAQIRNLDIPAPTNPQLRNQWLAQQENWNRFKKSLYVGRQRVKYENLLIKTNYVTTAEAERDYHNQNDVAEAKILFVPYFAMSDSTVKVSDADLKDYYKKNKEKYKSKFTRSLSYVSFPVVPSAEDSAKIHKEAEKVALDFKTVADDSLYAATNTEGATPYSKYTVANLPSAIHQDQLQAGNVIGPLLADGNYKIFKVVKAGKDTVYTAKASHILIRWDDETPAKKKEAKEKAQKILKEIKAGADFAAKAREFGSDGTASRGGDLGYFSSGQMVKPFQTAVFNAKKTGVLPELTETQFGYHIIDVTALKDNSFYNVATVEMKILPGDETHKVAYLKAQSFATGLSGIDAFKEKAKKENLNMLEAKDLSPNDQHVGNLGNARKVVTWLFRDAKKGTVSEFDVDDAYGVAVMTDETEEGYRSLEQVKDEITPAVRNELKAKKLIEKLSAQKGTLEELAKPFGNDAQINSTSDLKFSANSLPGAGLDPKAVGIVFSLDNGKQSKPFASENGVVVVNLQNKTIAPEVGDYTMFRNELEKKINSSAGLNIAQAIKDLSNIKDERYKFY
ncbi:MAG: peptidylprolyl isomerase [Bacteroidetes bacterium]|nr:peptidylprolyl isomerase [Bacteroidota bacterium]MBS1541391.1 peptidylprolyl isomerase [Bacteroidota bacterium]